MVHDDDGDDGGGGNDAIIVHSLILKDNDGKRHFVCMCGEYNIKLNDEPNHRFFFSVVKLDNMEKE